MRFTVIAEQSARSTGLDTDRRYPPSKIIDMVFVQEGINIDFARKERKAAEVR